MFCQQKNLKDSSLQSVARRKVAARTGSATDQPKYRDRALERRVLFNQPDAPLPEKDSGKQKKFEGPPPPPPSSPPPPVNLGQDGANVGNKLLKMMGWKEGTGLGTSGDGRVDPMYVLSIYPYLKLICSPQSNCYLCTRCWFGS
jgi:RNA-binding protein 5/10